MSHTHSSLLYHVVFSTKHHERLLTRDVRPELFAYMAALIKEKKGTPIIINGVEDHGHLLFGSQPDIAISDMMRFVKANSSRWISQRFDKAFAWQKGFGAFTVSRSNVVAVAKYIRDQEAHHAKKSFQEEYILLLEKNGVDYDEQYLWT